MSNSERPLSPHLTIYRWPITMLVSILHRMTGVALSMGLVVLTIWLVDAAAGPVVYQEFRETMSTMAGRLLLAGWSFAFFLHLGNGIRHLVWDTGRGLEKRQARLTAWLVLIFAAVLTAAYWGAAL